MVPVVVKQLCLFGEILKSQFLFIYLFPFEKNAQMSFINQIKNFHPHSTDFVHEMPYRLYPYSGSVFFEVRSCHNAT